MKKILISVLALAVLVIAGLWAAKDNHQPVEWAHGWKTSRITATRYSNPDIGYNIGFEFPIDQDKCDRTELADYVRSRSGNSYQMGGTPGATMYVVFKDVSDRPSADKKLRAILPEMSRLVASLK